MTEIYRSFIESYLADQDVLMISLKAVEKFPIESFYPTIKKNFNKVKIETLLMNLCDIMTKNNIINKGKEELLYEVTEAVEGDLEFIKKIEAICFRKNYFQKDSRV